MCLANNTITDSTTTREEQEEEQEVNDQNRTMTNTNTNTNQREMKMNGNPYSDAPAEEVSSAAEMEAGEILLMMMTTLKQQQQQQQEPQQQQEQQQEQHSSSNTTTAQFLDHDVILGKGTGPNKHAGNIAFRQMVAERREDYLETPRQFKTQIAQDIVDLVHRRGGRFLQRFGGDGSGGDDVWTEADPRVVLEKTKQSLRDSQPNHLMGKPQKRRDWNIDREEGPRCPGVSGKKKKQKQQEQKNQQKTKKKLKVNAANNSKATKTTTKANKTAAGKGKKKTKTKTNNAKPKPRTNTKPKRSRSSSIAMTTKGMDASTKEDLLLPEQRPAKRRRVSDATTTTTPEKEEPLNKKRGSHRRYNVKRRASQVTLEEESNEEEDNVSLQKEAVEEGIASSPIPTIHTGNGSGTNYNNRATTKTVLNRGTRNNGPLFVTP